MPDEITARGEIRVLGLTMKTELLMKRDGRTYQDLGNWRDVTRNAAWQFVNRNTKPAAWLPARTDGSTKWCDVDLYILDEICAFFGAPREWFTKYYTAVEFEAEIRTPLWARLLNLSTSDPDGRLRVLSAAEASPSGEQEATDLLTDFDREGLIAPSGRFDFSDEQPTGPSLSLAPGDWFYLKLSGWAGWRVIILRRHPNDRIDCVLPHPKRPLPNTLDAVGALRVPPQSELHFKIPVEDAPGIHTLVAIFHESPYLDRVVPTRQFIEQLSPRADASLREATIRQLVHWLEDQNNRGGNPRTFEVVSEQFRVRGR